MWKKVSEVKPEEGFLVLTKIEDEEGSRNEQKLMHKDNLWWQPDGMYIYYTPTHWKPIEK